MSSRSFVTAIAAAIMLYAGASLLAKPKPEDYTCCSSESDCGGLTCCDADSIGMVPCDSDLPGFCMTTCRRPNG